MALEAVVFPHDAFGAYAYCKDTWSSFLGGSSPVWNHGSFDSSEPSLAVAGALDSLNCSSPSTPEDQFLAAVASPPVVVDAPATTAGGRRKRRRSRTCKNREEVENQRMAHITVERNRRKQMNEYLAVLRSLMPPSYVQRGDQASIIGGAINYVKELEQMLEAQEGQKKIRKQDEKDDNDAVSPLPFSEFFVSPQYSPGVASETQSKSSESATVSGESAEERCGVADVAVTMVESHANVKIRSKKRPRQLLRIVSGFQSLRLTTLHLNVTTVNQTVLYSLSVKAEDGCQLNTVGDIAEAANQLLRGIHEETPLINR